MTKQKHIEFKQTGIEWMPSIPKHWEIRRLKNLSKSIQTGSTPKTTEMELYINNGDVNWFTPSDINELYISNSNRKVTQKAVIDGIVTMFEENSILVIGIGATLGKVAQIKMAGSSNQQINAITFNNNCYPNYGLYYLFSIEKVIKSISNASTLAILTQTDLKDLVMPYPPIEEQKAIADFLDRQSEKINTFIEKKKRFIELLKEQRQSIINEAVTKGVNPKAKMKPSGIEWLGDIPKHWEVRRLRYLGTCQNGVNKGEGYFGSGFPFLNYSDVYKNFEVPLKIEGLALSSLEDRENYSVIEGDVFFTRTSETAKEIAISSVCMKTIENATFSGFLIRFRPYKEILDKEFSKYYFRCELNRSFFVKEMNLITRASLSQDLLKNLPVVLPPLSEQKEIVARIKQETEVIDIAISKAEKEIELIKEYKESMIAEAVIGKIGV